MRIVSSLTKKHDEEEGVEDVENLMLLSLPNLAWLGKARLAYLA